MVRAEKASTPTEAGALSTPATEAGPMVADAPERMQAPITFTVSAQANPRALILRELVAEITEGEWAGTTFCAAVGGGPVLSVKHSSGFHTESWIGVMPLLQAWLEAIRPTMEDAT